MAAGTCSGCRRRRSLYAGTCAACLALPSARHGDFNGGAAALRPSERIEWRFDRSGPAVVLSPRTTLDYADDDEVRRLVLVDTGVWARSLRRPVQIRSADGAVLLVVQPVYTGPAPRMGFLRRKPITRHHGR